MRARRTNPGRTHREIDAMGVYAQVKCEFRGGTKRHTNQSLSSDSDGHPGGPRQFL